MNKLRYYFLFIAFAGIFIACKQSVKGSNGVVYKTAVEYNDYIISRQSTLIKNVMDFVQVSQTDLDSADKMLDKNVAIISIMINDLNGMPAYKGDSTLRNTGINLFQFYKKVFGNDYKKLIELRKNGEDSASIAEINEIVQKVTKEEESYDKNFHNAQRDFAQKNNMKLTDNEMQKNIDKMK
jgi:hypothetical protein